MSKIFSTFGCPNTIIEVGVYEGYTTFWMSDVLHQYNPDLKIYAIDPHVGSNDLTDVDFNEIKSNFCHNLQVNDKKNVEYISKHSNKGLIDLINQGTKAQLIYIDGDHKAAEVLTDLTLSWQLLDVGGVIICDDASSWVFTDKNGTSSPHMSPRMAIEMFISCYWDRIKPIDLPNGTQTAFMKIKD
jgi:predicted O-methyltransferase YrrM